MYICIHIYQTYTNQKEIVYFTPLRIYIIIYDYMLLFTLKIILYRQCNYKL
jgi:hypothetical protein